MRRTVLALSAGLLTVVVAGCGSDRGTPAAAGTTAGMASPGATSGSITVLAAASLTESFTTLATGFETAHPGSTVTLSFAASSALARQITSGAPADVFASASTTTMQQVVDAGEASAPTDFATNTMEIAVPPDNPAGVTGVDSLSDPAVKTAVCQPQVPCGATAQKVFAAADLTVRPVTLEPDVKSVLSKVVLDEVDAGMVYVTDVAAAGSTVQGVPIPAAVNATTAYPIAVLTGSTEPAAARAFVDYVLSPAGQAVLSVAGFAKP